MRLAIAIGVVLATMSVTPGAAVAAPDLTVTRVSNPPTVAGIGAVIRAGDTTANRGDSTAPASITHYYLSRDARRSSGDRLLGRRGIPKLAARRSWRGGGLFAIPRVRPGAYRVLACATPRRSPDDPAANNCRASFRKVAIQESAAPFTAWNDPNLAGFTAGDAPRPIAPNVTVTDEDDAMMSGATVRIVGPEQGEQLFFERMLGITGTYDSGTGVLTLRGRTSTANYEGALRSVSYSHSGDTPSPTRTFEIRVRDAVGVESVPIRHTYALAR